MLSTPACKHDLSGTWKQVYLDAFYDAWVPAEIKRKFANPTA